MKDKRINSGGTFLNYTCENSRFKTDIASGHEHFPGQGYKGSVTAQPLYDDGDNSLWLEHVIDKSNNNHCYWFMWYNNSGYPNVFMSAVIDEDAILEVIKNISQIRL